MKSGQHVTLLRVLGPGMAVAIVVGNVIGSGIFATPGGIAADGRGFPLIISAWVFGGVLSLLGGLCFAELGAMLPRAGGMYVYLKHAYGRPVGYLQGWTQFVFGNPGSLGALSIIFVAHLGEVLFPDSATGISRVATLALSVSLIVGLAMVNIAGVLWGGWVQTLTTIFKAGVVLAVAVLPFCVVGEEQAESMSTLWSTALPTKDGMSGDASRFAVVLLAVMWAYNGWHGITPVAEEVREPGRNIPRAVLIGVGILTTLYVSANIAYHLVVPMEEMVLEENRKKVAVLLFDRLLGPIGGTLMAVGVMVSTFGAINSNLLLGPRVPFAMGRDDALLHWLGEVSPRFRSPARAIAVQAMMGVVLLVSSTMLADTLTAGGAATSVFDLMTSYIVFSSSIFYMLAVGAVVILRRKHPEWERPFRVHWLIPTAYLVFYSWFLFHVLIGKPMEAGIGIAMSLSGIPVLVAGIAWAKWRGQTGPGADGVDELLHAGNMQRVPIQDSHGTANPGEVSPEAVAEENGGPEDG